MPNAFDVLPLEKLSSPPATSDVSSPEPLQRTPSSSQTAAAHPTGASLAPVLSTLSADSALDNASSSQASCSEKDEVVTPPHTPLSLHPSTLAGQPPIIRAPSASPSRPAAQLPSHGVGTKLPYIPSVAAAPLNLGATAQPAPRLESAAPPAPPDTRSAATTTQQGEKNVFWTKVYQRTALTFAMIGGFMALLLLGHPYMILLVTLLATMVYNEVASLFNELPSQEPGSGSLDDQPGERNEALWNKTLTWYMFSISNYYLYGESLVYYLKHIVYDETVSFVPFARSHRFLSLMLYVFGFMAFILHLRRDNLQTQFGLFAWVHMSLFLIVVCGHFMVNSILEGLIWFWVPASLIICNDVFAYVCGMLFGHTPLISLSPKKTREGFVGAFVITVVFGYFWGSLFQQFDYMVCPAVSLGENAWSNLTCDRNPVFHWQYLALPERVSTVATAVLGPLMGGKSITRVPYTLFQLHTMLMASFASLVGPFGGFFASGFKRAYGIKDFGDSIPGHGGLTDRFDCQFLMGLWAYTYYTALIREHHTSVHSVLEMATRELGTDQLVELYKDVGHYLAGQAGGIPV